jgi:hypothetical protein
LCVAALSILLLAGCASKTDSAAAGATGSAPQAGKVEGAEATIPNAKTPASNNGGAAAVTRSSDFSK